LGVAVPLATTLQPPVIGSDPAGFVLSVFALTAATASILGAGAAGRR
jgi:hypothetical protein